MEFEGTVYKIMPATKGTSARGDWQRQEVIFEMPSEFSRKVCVTLEKLLIDTVTEITNGRAVILKDCELPVEKNISL